LIQEDEMQVKFVRSLVIAATVVMSAATGMVPASAQQPPAGAPAGGQGRGRGPQVPPLLMTTTAFEDGGVIPAKFVGAMGVSPELKWTQVPMGTESFVLLLHDPEPALNKGLMDVTHWLVWNIPATATGLPEGVAQGAELPDGSRQVSLRANGYMGPGAPPGPYHHYTFELYALDTKVTVPVATPQQAAATRTAVMQAMDGHILGKAIIVGRFHQ
jgi:Raf kinase inhibitor-like YbhB/YbcL family protein